MRMVRTRELAKLQTVKKKLTNGAVCMEICVFYFWFGDIYKSTAGVPNPNYLNKNTNTNVRMDPRYTGASW